MPTVSNAHDMVVLLWELRGRTGKPATCSLQHPPKRAVTLAVHIGDELVASESYPDMKSAVVRGATIREQLTENGWMVSYNREDASFNP